MKILVIVDLFFAKWEFGFLLYVREWRTMDFSSVDPQIMMPQIFHLSHWFWWTTYFWWCTFKILIWAKLCQWSCSCHINNFAFSFWFLSLFHGPSQTASSISIGTIERDCYNSFMQGLIHQVRWVSALIRS